MNIDQIEQLCVSQNMHWAGRNYPRVETKKKRSIYERIWNNIINNRPILVVSGARRVGKSYLLAQLIEEILESKIAEPTNIFYFQFSSSHNTKNFIFDVLTLYISKYANINKRIYIFLDEVQFIDYWQDQVKQFYDQYLNIKFVITGSTSLSYKQKSKESLLGRTVRVNMSVLSFAEYLEFKGIKSPFPSLPNFEEKISSSDTARFKAALPIFRSEFKKYLAFGQYPEVVINNSSVDPKEYILSISDQLINYDIPYFSKKVERPLFTDVVKTLSFSIANQYSLNKIAVSFESDRRIVGEYLKLLEEFGLFSSCLNHFFQGMRRKLSAIKKIYSLNTNLSLGINGFGIEYLGDSRVFGQYFENYAFMRIRDNWGDVEYYQSRSKELDFITRDFAFEVKSGEARNIQKYVDISENLGKKLILITESELEQVSDQYRKIPIYLL